MPIFKYKAALANGKKTGGIIDAANRSLAVRKIREQGMFPISIAQVESRGFHKASQARARTPLRLFHRVPRDAVAASIRQLATLLNAGLPLDKALDGVIQGDGRQDELQRIMTEVLEIVREGGDLATAFSKYPHVFNTTFVTMVHAGETSGTLDLVMERLADHIDQQLALRRKIQATMAYPVLMLIVGVCVVVFLLSFVVPKVTAIFFDMQRALPVPTRILIGTSDFIRHGWGFIALFLLGAGLLFHRFSKTERGRKSLHALYLRLPILGDVIRQLSLGRFSKTLGMLLKNGVTLVSALEIVKSVVTNEKMKGVIEEMHHEVQEGKPLSGPMARSGIFSHASVQMVMAGEQSGRLDEMLFIVANDSESKVNTKLQLLTSLMEPIMILLLGGMVGFVVMAIMLPIFQMSSLVGG